LVEVSSPSAFRRALKLSCKHYQFQAPSRALTTQEETYTSEANLVAEMVETTNALLRVTDIGKFGEAETEVCKLEMNK
jgi:hypothetical protein